ncbi:hypothetical protein KGG72_gp73 [Streptomyces phage Salutena]|uniref:Uncharacterized protein n=1 Tax=Streptomyces phage Salutena TaxID=2767576 RepID=A0A7S6R739_9CAUD|nr:hypothetical protein KGG72_gp73 [Streptomyces phage Salutena]QOV06203.1 hypothetical protein CPT_Salutena_073 [Streptomyces phage Salutena]
MSLDRDTLNEIAERCLERPSDAMFWDDRLFTTHGAMLHWAELGDDVLEESNYLSALELIKGAAGDLADEHVIDGTSRHFACGSLRTIYVQVYESYEDYECECEPYFVHEDGCNQDEDSWYCENFCLVECDGEECLPEQEFTAAFEEAAEILVGLQDYPIVDESDYNEREWNQFEETLKEAVEYAQREYTLVDSVEDDEAIAQLFYEDESTTHRMAWCRAEDVDWEVVADEYRATRDAYFEERAYEVYRWHVLGYNPDQLELDFAV